jgi:hypothetical protein
MHTRKIAGHIIGTGLMSESSQGERRAAQNELTAGLMPGHGFMCAGAVNVTRFWDEDGPWASGCEGMDIEKGNEELLEAVEGVGDNLSRSAIRESCSSRKLGSGVPRSSKREEALTTSFKEVVMMAWDKGDALIAINGSFPKEECQDVRCPSHICHSFVETRRLYSRTPIAATSRLRKIALGIPVISCLRGLFVGYKIGRKELRTRF